MRLYFKNWGSKIVPQKFYIIKKIFNNDAYMLEIKNLYYTFNLIINIQKLKSIKILFNVKEIKKEKEKSKLYNFFQKGIFSFDDAQA